MIHGAPHYTYNLPCGHAVRSYTPALPVPDEDHGWWVWLWCRTCDEPVALSEREAPLCEAPPRKINGARVSEVDISRRIDEAILRERIVRILDDSRGAVTDREVIAACTGVSQNMVTTARVFWRQQRGVDEMDVAA